MLIKVTDIRICIFYPNFAQTNANRFETFLQTIGVLLNCEIKELAPNRQATGKFFFSSSSIGVCFIFPYYFFTHVIQFARRYIQAKYYMHRCKLSLKACHFKILRGRVMSLNPGFSSLSDGTLY